MIRCNKGLHELTPANTYNHPAGMRICKACERIRDSRRRRNKGKQPGRQTLDAAVIAYRLRGETALAIQERLGLHNQKLYRELEKRGLPLQGRKKKANPAQRNDCAYCRAPLPAGRKKYCCRAHMIAVFQKHGQECRGLGIAA